MATKHMPHLQLASPSSGMQYGGSTDVEVYGHARAPLLEQLAQCPCSCLSLRCVRPSSSSPAGTRSCPRSHLPLPGNSSNTSETWSGQAEQQPEHVGAASHSGRLEHVRDAILTLAQDEQWVPPQQLLHEHHIPG